MLEIVSYRLSATGFWGYSFYRNRQETGRTGCRIGTTSTVRITGEDVDWYSQFNIDSRLVPGVSRKVKDNGTGEELYRIIFWRPGLYELSAGTSEGEWSMIVEEQGTKIAFGRFGLPAAAVTERIGEAEWLPASAMRAEPAFRTVFYEQEDSPGFLMMVLSFPALKMI